MSKTDVSCVFCLKSANSGENSFRTATACENVNKVTGTFFKLLQRHLNREILHVNVNIEESLASLLFKSSDAIEKVDFGINSCQDCTQLMNHFLDLYEQLKLTELKINWAVRMFADVMSTATKIDARVKRFNDSVRTKTPKNDSLDRIRFKGIYDFRRDLIKKCYDQYNLQPPKVSLKRKSMIQINQIKTEMQEMEKTKKDAPLTPSTQNRVLRSGPQLSIRRNVTKKRLHWKVQKKLDEAKTFQSNLPCVTNPISTLEQNPIVDIKPELSQLQLSSSSPVKSDSDVVIHTEIKLEITPPPPEQSEPLHETHVDGPTIPINSAPIKYELIKSEPIKSEPDVDVTPSKVPEKQEQVKNVKKRIHSNNKMKLNSCASVNGFDSHSPADSNANVRSSAEHKHSDLKMQITPPVVKLYNGNSSSTLELDVSVERQQLATSDKPAKVVDNLNPDTLMALTTDRINFTSSPFPWVRDQLITVSSQDAVISPDTSQEFMDMDMETTGGDSEEKMNSSQEPETDDEILQKYTSNGCEYNGKCVYVVTPSPPENEEHRIQVLSQSLTPAQLQLAAASLHQPKYQCAVKGCDEQFVFEHHLQIHTKLHGEFTCVLCPHVESYAPNLAHHVLAYHTADLGDDNPEVVCAICPPSVPLAAEHHIFHFLEKHLHLDVSSLGCLICHSDISNRGAGAHFRKDHHVLGKTPSDFHQCEQCPAFFVTKCKLSAHSLSVHNNIPIPSS